MEKFNIHKNNKKDSTKLHKDSLGMDIPKGYFSASKLQIMEKVYIPNKEKPRVFYLKPGFRYLMAASIVLLIGLGIVLKYNTNTTSTSTSNTVNIENLASVNDQDILINSLFVNDDEMGNFLDTYLMNDIVVKAEVEEQEFDNIFLNSVIEKDSLIDSYIDDNFIDNIIL